MTNSRTLSALTHWMALDAEERRAFDRGREALAAVGFGGEPRSPGVTPSEPQFELSFGGAAPTTSVVSSAVLPLGSGQRSPRLLVPNYDQTVFASAAATKLMAGGRAVRVYVASCRGTAALYRESQTTIYKAGTTTGCAQARIAGLNGIGYAGWRRSGQVIVEEDGYRSWRIEQLPATTPRPRNSPVTVDEDGLAVSLPASLSAEAFDIAVAEGLAPVSLSRLLATPRFRLGLVSSGFDPERLERYSPRADGSGHKRAAELARLQPRRDADDLASLAEGIVARHLHDQLRAAA